LQRQCAEQSAGLSLDGSGRFRMSQLSLRMMELQDAAMPQNFSLWEIAFHMQEVYI
jgi:hypothetical protein